MAYPSDVIVTGSGRKRGQLGCIQMNKDIEKEKVFPAHSVKDYNNAVVNCTPGSVHGMKVYF